MFKTFVGLVLSLVLVTSLFGEVKVGETLSGEKAKESKMAPKGLKTFAIEDYNLLASGSSSVVSLEDFDIYYDVNILNIIMIDFRNTRQGAWE
ncbi:Uncharacterised protein [Helicobacter pullorum]|uniref:hypothetical protein n=1 Tax=Helicobacter pullorum TaxID=35818 RepID=UPI000F7109E6|nr:hypothetical protein [Helicobacter pullorum]VEJ06651.1 Uncharacterised protein [Helicobacter pullorum]